MRPGGRTCVHIIKFQLPREGWEEESSFYICTSSIFLKMMAVYKETRLGEKEDLVRWPTWLSPNLLLLPLLCVTLSLSLYSSSPSIPFCIFMRLFDRLPGADWDLFRPDFHQVSRVRVRPLKVKEKDRPIQLLLFYCLGMTPLAWTDQTEEKLSPLTRTVNITCVFIHFVRRRVNRSCQLAKYKTFVQTGILRETFPQKTRLWFWRNKT